MFIDIDYNKRKQQAKFHLAKPNKRVIDIIDEKFNDNMSIKLGNVNELDFSIPYQIEKDDVIIINPHIDTIKEKMLIRVTLGTYKEWYIVDSIEEDSSDSNVFNVKAYSLPYELKGKRISGYDEDSINATELLTNLLESTIWKIDKVDAMFDEMFRSFDSGADSNVLDCIIKAGETFGALIVWDTIGRKVSFKDATKNGRFRGMTVNYGRFLNSLKRTRTTDEMVTRLYVYGNEDLSIRSVNPTGMPYIENFGYFMFPFKRDENKNVIESSYFMSDELCHALLDHEVIVAQNASRINELINQIAIKSTELVTAESKEANLQGEVDNLQAQVDVALSTGDEKLADQRKKERDAKKSELEGQSIFVFGIKAFIDRLNNELDELQSQISMEETFTEDLLDELNLYIIESAWRDDNYIDENELYGDAIKKFDELRQPKVVIDVTIENLLNIIEEQYYWDKITLGDLIKVRYPQMNIEYMAKIIQIDYDLANSEISLTIANTTDLLSETDKLVQLLYNSSSASTIIQNNKYKWDKVAYVQDKVGELISNEWDATKNKIIAGVNNSVEVGNRGIIVKNPDFPDEIVILQSGVLALSKDGGETWKTAIKPDGIVAERLIGRLIAGEELVITNSHGSFVFDNRGVYIEADSFIISSSSGKNLVKEWSNTTEFINAYTDDGLITPYEKKSLKEQWDKITAVYNNNNEKIARYWGDEANGLTFVVYYRAMYTELYNFLFFDKQQDGVSLFSDMNTVTPVDAVNFKMKFNRFEDAQLEVDKQLALRATDLAIKAQKDADDAKKRIDEVIDDVVYRVQLYSTNGDKFNNGRIDTTVYVVVYKGTDNITDTLPDSSFIWRKTNSNGVDDVAWNNAHRGVGKQIKITSDDVHKKATFWCDINIIE